MIAPECPCGSGDAYDACCGRLHRGAAQARSPLELMRARYAAYATGDLDFVFRSWHPRTRPLSIEPDHELRWTGLEVVEAVDAEVTFVASYVRRGVVGVRGELSRFEQRRGRWVYVDGDTIATT